MYTVHKHTYILLVDGLYLIVITMTPLQSTIVNVPLLQIAKQVIVRNTKIIKIRILVHTSFGRGHCDFRFCSFGYFLDRFFRFCAKRLRFFGFGVHCGLRIFRFLAFGFGFCHPMCFSGFPILSYLVSGFS